MVYANVTGTRLTTAIHRRLFSGFFSVGVGTSVHRLNLRRVVRVSAKKYDIEVYLFIQ